MKLRTKDGVAVYYNIVIKRGQVRYIVKAATGQTLSGRDRQKLRSRTFTQEHQAEEFLTRNGYTETEY